MKVFATLAFVTAIVGVGCTTKPSVRPAQFPKGLTPADVDQMIAIIQPELDEADAGTGSLGITGIEEVDCTAVVCAPGSSDVAGPGCEKVRCSPGADRGATVKYHLIGGCVIDELVRLERIRGVWRAVKP